MSSILVRKFCQPILDEAGYSMFHCTLGGNHWEPKMKIYTTCGQEFAEVDGVTFSKAKPSVAECEYSATLLEQWLNRHAVDFAEYVDAYTEFHSASAPKAAIKRLSATISIHERKQVKISREFPYMDTDGKERTFMFIYITNNTLDKFYQIHWPSHVPMTPAIAASRLKLPNSIINAGKRLVEEHASYWELRKRLEDAEAQIKVCKI